jgi:PqqD family protein of HPr-rel-A system
MAAAKPRAQDGLAVVDIDGEAVVYDHASGGQIHYLNHSAALVLDLCDGTATVRQMAEAIAEVYEMPADDVEKQVRTVVGDLRDLGVLAPTRKPVADPVASTNGSETADTDADLDQREIVRMEVPRNT